MAAISRYDLTESVIENGQISSLHFVGGRPLGLFDELNLSWLPSVNLGRFKVNRKRVLISKEMYRRKKAHSERLTILSDIPTSGEVDRCTVDSCVESSISKRRAEQHILINEEGSEKCISSKCKLNLLAIRSVTLVFSRS